MSLDSSSRKERFAYFSSLRINLHCPSISHFFSSDDSLLFFRANDRDWKAIKEVLDETYEKASGQTINLDKSRFMAIRILSMN